MKGFLAGYLRGAKNVPENPEWNRRLTAWEAGLHEGGLKKSVSGPFTLWLYSRSIVPCESNQRLIVGAGGGAMHLYAGPRVDLSQETLPLPSAGTAAEAARDARLFTRGMETAVLIAARADGSLLVKTDLLNSLYVYVLETPTHVWLSTSSLLLAHLAGAGIDAVPAAEFLATGSIYGNRSLYQNISTLKPSRMYVWKGAAARSEAEYWRIGEIAFGSLGIDKALEQMLIAIDEDCKRLKGLGRYVFDLTGGYDSRCNLGFALRNRLDFRTTVSGPESDEDVRVAAAIAAHYRLKHTRVESGQRDAGGIGPGAAAALVYADGEYDAIEYTKIMDIHARDFAPTEISVHGSTADVMRNYFLHPSFYKGSPTGDVDFAGLIAKRFPPSVDVRRLMRPAHAFDWAAHIRERIGQYDLEGRPAFARLDNIYLRIRMQFWQGRIASATNRIHGSFTPWNNIDALSAVLACKWEDKRSHMLSRALLSRLHPGLTGFPIAGGNVAGPGALDTAMALPRKAVAFAAKVRNKLLKPPPRPGAELDSAFLRKEVPARIGILQDILDPQAFQAGGVNGIDYSGNAKVLARAYTLIAAAESLASGRAP